MDRHVGGRSPRAGADVTRLVLFHLLIATLTIGGLSLAMQLNLKQTLVVVGCYAFGWVFNRVV